MLWEWIKVAFPPNGYKFTIQSQFATLANKQIMSLIPFSALFYTFFKKKEPTGLDVVVCERAAESLEAGCFTGAQRFSNDGPREQL